MSETVSTGLDLVGMAGDLLVILGERALSAGELDTDERGLGLTRGVSIFCGWSAWGGRGLLTIISAGFTVMAS